MNSCRRECVCLVSVAFDENAFTSPLICAEASRFSICGSIETLSESNRLVHLFDTAIEYFLFNISNRLSLATILQNLQYHENAFYSRSLCARHPHTHTQNSIEKFNWMNRIFKYTFVSIAVLSFRHSHKLCGERCCFLLLWPFSSVIFFDIAFIYCG